MDTCAYKLIDNLSYKHSRSQNDYEFVMSFYTPVLAEYAARERMHSASEKAHGRHLQQSWLSLPFLGHKEHGMASSQMSGLLKRCMLPFPDMLEFLV